MLGALYFSGVDPDDVSSRVMKACRVVTTVGRLVDQLALLQLFCLHHGVFGYEGV